MKLPTIMTHDGRRAWAFAALVGGAMVFTVFAAVGVWLNRNNEDHSFWLALAAHAQVFGVLCAIGALLVKRTIKAGKGGIEYSDHGNEAE